MSIIKIRSLDHFQVE